MLIRKILITAILFSLFSCGGKKQIISENEFQKDKENWRKNRTAYLKNPYGWLSLSGLFWLKEGINTFGSGEKNDIVFPNSLAPASVGTFNLNKDGVTAVINKGLKVIADGKPVSVLELIPDDSTDETIMNWGPLRWYLVKRGDQYGIRLKDTTNAVYQKFKGMDMYPASKKWLFRAKFTRYDPYREIFVPDILGNTNKELSPGYITFTYKREKYKLDLLNTTYEGHYFLVFADRTNGEGTYGAGRFAYVPMEDSTGYTLLDFNKAYSPPCIFTPFATCPLPPMQNRLPFKVTAGEKSTGYDDH